MKGKRKKTARERVLAYVRKRKTGATGKEVVRATKLPYSTATTRMTELLRDGVLYDSGVVRKHASVLRVRA